MFAQYCFLVPRVSKELLSLCAGSQAINGNDWKPSKNQAGCRTTHFEAFYSNYGYPWMLVASLELEHQQNCPHPPIPLQKNFVVPWEL